MNRIPAPQSSRAEETLQAVHELALSGKVTLPPLPENALQILMLLQEEYVNADLIVRVIRTDPAFAGALLRMANSAFYAGFQPVTNLNLAVTRVGLNQVGTVITTALYRGQFESFDADWVEVLERLWNHAIYAALACRGIMQRTCGDTESSYLAGLFHNVGQLLMLKAIDRFSTEHPTRAPSLPEVREMIGYQHAELAFRVVSEWRLPPGIARAVRGQVGVTASPGLTGVLRAGLDLLPMIEVPEAGATPNISEDLLVVREYGIPIECIAPLLEKLRSEMQKLRHVL